jgi:hypothetical protein
MSQAQIREPLSGELPATVGQAFLPVTRSPRRASVPLAFLDPVLFPLRSQVGDPPWWRGDSRTPGARGGFPAPR